LTLDCTIEIESAERPASVAAVILRHRF